MTFYAGNDEYEVGDAKGHITYNIKTKSCDCRVWDLTGIPCIH